MSFPLVAARKYRHTLWDPGEKMATTKVMVNHNGSIRVEGDFEIVDPEGKPFGLAGRTTISLCRCGHSANKPFCDGSHKVHGFSDSVTARELPPPKPKL
jgi:CDGSH-type Zn-finger protein